MNGAQMPQAVAGPAEVRGREAAARAQGQREAGRRPRPLGAFGRVMVAAALLWASPGQAFAQTVLDGPPLTTPAKPATPTAPAAAPSAAGAPPPARECPPVPHPPSAEEVQAGLRSARDRGMLWRVTKDRRVSYLYGTIHVGRLEWVFPGPKLVRALRETDAVALEIDPTDPRLQQEMAAASQRDAGTPALPADLQRRLAAQIAAACLAPSQLAGQHPVMQAVTLSVLAARREGLDPVYAQEFMLVEAARAAKKPIVSLETIAMQMDSLLPDDPQETVHQVEGVLDQLEGPGAAQVLQQLARAWEQGRLDEMADYESWCQCAETPEDRRFLRRLLDDRNPHLASRIAEEIRKGRRLFAAVGALHMTGPLALPTLLAREGFTVERVDLSPP